MSGQRISMEVGIFPPRRRLGYRQGKMQSIGGQYSPEVPQPIARSSLALDFEDENIRTFLV